MGLFKKKRNHKHFAVENNGEKTLHKHLQFTAIEQYKLLRANLDFTLP
jgi:hypothetical protein